MKKKLKYHEIKNILADMQKEGVHTEEIEKFMLEHIEENPINALNYKKAFFSIIKDIDLKLAVKYGEEVIKEYTDVKFINVLATRYKKLGNHIRHAALTTQKIPTINFKSELNKRLNEHQSSQKLMQYIDTFIETYPHLEHSINKIAFSQLKDIHTKEAIKYGEKVIQKEQNPKFMLVLASRYKKLGKIKEHDKLYEILENNNN